MGFQCGIVGLPNVGKSTIFNAITKAGAEAANYPFCTIEPNVGVVQVPDERVEYLKEIVQPEKTIYATMEFVDIAGLVAGASKGEGLGNKFLGHIRETQAIAHVVRCFEDDDITHVNEKPNPAADVEVINLELILADLESAEKQKHRIQKTARGGDKDAAKELAVIDKCITHLEAGKSVRLLELNDDEKKIAAGFHFITTKPVLYVANVSEEYLSQDNDLVNALRDIAQSEGAALVKLSGKIESELADMEPDEAKEFLKELGSDSSGLERMIRSGYELLELITYFTAGKQEVRAWTIKQGTKAPGAAGVIHTDFEKGFIRAEVTAFDDVKAAGGLGPAKDAGKMRLEGKEYVMHDGDVCHFRFNV